MREAHLRDAVALCEFLCWIEDEIASGKTLTEVEVSLAGWLSKQVQHMLWKSERMSGDDGCYLLSEWFFMS